MKTLESFTSGGGILKGGQTSSHETYEGAPRPYNRELMSNPTEADLSPGQTGLGSGAHHTGGTGSTGMRPDSGYSGANTDGYNSGVGPHSSSMANKADPRVDSDLDGSRGFGNTAGTTGGMGNTTGGMGRDSMGTSGSGRQFGEVTDHTRGNDFNTTTNTTTSTSTEHKPSMIDRLNPLKKTST